MSKIKQKAVVAMSGGVDSSVAAMLLKEQGHEVIGMFMKLGINQQENEAAARRVCQKLKIKFYPINIAGEFKKEVIDYFLTSYSKGLTPNPCVKCNQLIKFNTLLKHAKKAGADYLATGHYARLKREMPNAKCQMPNLSLLRGKDKNKDQSYFLYTLTQKQLKYILFPLGDYTKEKVRKIADKAKLPYLKKESQDVCFLTGDHNDFLTKHLKLKPGPIKILPHPNPPLIKGRELKGGVIGKHQGLPLYTIGQRRGVEIGGIGPFYVARRDYKTNTLYVVKDGDDPALYKDELEAKNLNWISGHEPKLPLKCEAVIRYRHKPVQCIITSPPAPLLIRKGEKGERYLVKFAKPQRAITPGQSVVLYQKDEVLGGGIII